MLRDAALESAKDSKFESLQGAYAGELYELRYKFVLELVDSDTAPDWSYKHVDYDASTNTITISGKAPAGPICTLYAEFRVRSAKCLFLWRCGLK